MKTCTVCSIAKPESNFRKYSGRSRDGLRPLCKECQRAYEARWRSNNKEYRAEARRKRTAANKLYRQKYDRTNRGMLLASEAGRRARKRSLPYDLDQHIPEIEARVQRAVCEMTGLTLDLTAGRKRVWNSPSLDRIEPAKGYTYSNIRIVCFAINACLGDWGEEILQNVMSAWLQRI